MDKNLINTAKTFAVKAWNDNVCKDDVSVIMSDDTDMVLIQSNSGHKCMISKDTLRGFEKYGEDYCFYE